MSDRPKITPTENGPYLIEGASEIRRMLDGEAIPLKATARLCRCGGSQNKPFCDGTHNRKGFSSAKDPDRVPDRRHSYTSGDRRITVHDNRGLCAHAGYCTDNLAQVFRMGTEPFVDPDGATLDEIMAVIDRCPSGALGYTVDDGASAEPDGPPTIAFPPGGPYLISGPVDLVDVEQPDGGLSGQCALCRCGASQNKPFCSGRHWYVEFDEDAATVASE